MNDILSTEYLINLHGMSKRNAKSLLKFAISKSISHIECYGNGSIIYPMWIESNGFGVPKMDNQLPPLINEIYNTDNKYIKLDKLSTYHWRGKRITDLKTKEDFLGCIYSYLNMGVFTFVDVLVKSKTSILSDEIEVLNETIKIQNRKLRYLKDTEELLNKYQKL